MKRAGFVVLLCLLLAGCGVFRKSMDIDYNDHRLNEGLQSLLHQKKSGKLSDFTSWTWDEVHLFHEFTDREFIEKTVGAPVIKSKFYDSKASLLIFEDHGKRVKPSGSPQTIYARKTTESREVPMSS